MREHVRVRQRILHMFQDVWTVGDAIQKEHIGHHVRLGRDTERREADINGWQSVFM